MTGSPELDQGLGTLLHFSALATRSRRALLLLCLSCFGLFGRWLLCDLGYFSFFKALSLLPPFFFSSQRHLWREYGLEQEWVVKVQWVPPERHPQNGQ